MSEMATLYAVVLILPSEVEQVLDKLRGDYSKHMTYINVPHITLEYPFVPKVDMTIIYEKLEAVAKRTKPFALVLKGIEYFKGTNNVAYAAIEKKWPVIDLHTDIVHSLKGLIKEEDGERYELERFTPHVTIGECIPSEVFPRVKQRFSESKLYCEVKITSFALFSADEKGMWKTAHVFKLSE